MSTTNEKHHQLTEVRIQAYLRLFGDSPTTIFSSPRFSDDDDEPFPIDVFVFTLDAQAPIVLAVTNGLSDRRMIDREDPQIWARRELIQYFPVCTEDHARRLHDMAWVPLFDGFLIDSHHSMTWEYPAIEGTPWTNAFYLEPIVRSHRDFRFVVEEDEVSFLWHIPISDLEREYKRLHGSNALIDRMSDVRLPWVFDENNRPSLL